MPRRKDDIASNQARAPLWEELRRYAGEPLVPFHTPGHKAGIALESGWGEADFLSRLDLSEISSLEWAEAWDEAENLAAEFYHAERSFFLVQGATQGLAAGLLGAFGPGDSVLVDRNCHLAVIHGMILAGLNPVFVEPEFLPDWNLPAGVAPDVLQNRCAAFPGVKGFIVTNPTYQGIATSLEIYREIIGDRILIVDEAHGGHLGWLGYPACEAWREADLWVHGTHKILGSLTQTGMLHLRGGRIDPARVRRALRFLSTTSPSYILLASLDSNRRFLAQTGRQLFNANCKMLRELKKDLATLEGLAVLDEAALQREFSGRGRVCDPWKLCLSFRNLGITGFEAEALYRKNWIQPEYADLDQVTFFIAPWQDEAPVEQLAAVTKLIWKYGAAERNSRRSGIEPPPGGGKPISALYTLPHQAMNPREAALGAVAEMPLSRAAGRIAASVVAPYPPGVPLLVPGEVIRAEDVALLRTLLDQGGEVRGVDSGMVSVVIKSRQDTK